MNERDAHRAERDTEIMYWLGKKALEYRGSGSKQDIVRADVINLMASKISRGAVRPDNTRLPAGVAPGFFQPGHTYVRQHHGEYVLFAVASVASGPDHGSPTAFGWRKAPGEDWEPTDSDDMDGWTVLDRHAFPPDAQPYTGDMDSETTLDPYTTTRGEPGDGA